MAAQTRTMTVPLMTQSDALPSGSILTHIARVLIQPRTFFSALPANHQWLLIALLVLTITAFTTTIQSQSTSSTSSTTPSAGFDLSLLNESATGASPTTDVPVQQSTTWTSADSDTTLMNGLVAASAIVAAWVGETILLSLVSMLRGYPPQIGKNLQIAVWASLPLTLMLVLRYLHYSNGGTGGSLGLSLLLDTWSGYRALPKFAQRLLAVLLSNLTLFWLWNIGLLYLGARFALGGRRPVAALVIAMWIAVATLVPVFTGEPQTRITALTPTTSTQIQSANTQNSGTAATTQQSMEAFGGGQMPSGGQMPMGEPPSGGPPTGN